MKTLSMFKPYVNQKAIDLVAETLSSGWIGEGPKVQEFERRLGELLETAYPIAVNTGTAALHLALKLAGVDPGDEVITTAQTMLATSQAILASGAAPVYADVEYLTGNIEAADIAARITPRTRAVLCVDWGGYPCDYDAIATIARQHNLIIIEDAAHAIGASYHGKAVGSLVPFTCFSFQAIKHLTTGDGGLLCVSNEEDYHRAVRLRWYGIDRFQRVPSILGEPVWNVTELGYKYHMNDIAASIGLGNLEDFPRQLQRRRDIAATYQQRLRDVPGITVFQRADDRKSADWLYSIHVERREDFCRMMQSHGINVSVVHLRIDRNDICGGERRDLPNLDRFTDTHISLPLHPFLTDDDVDYIITHIHNGW